MRNKTISLRNTEFDWLGYCISCNIDCCHNKDASIPPNECAKPGIEKAYIKDDDSKVLIERLAITTATNIESRIETGKTNLTPYDNRPLECQIFPFDVMDIDGRLEWVKRNNCHAETTLSYEKFINFFEKQFAKKWQLEQIKQYVENDKLNNPNKYTSNNYTRIREINWPS